MKHKIKSSYKLHTDAELVKLALRIVESLNNNPNFPNPNPDRATLGKALQEFQQALSSAGRNDRTRVSAKNDKKAILVRLLFELATYVEAIAQGDKTVLLSSGFNITGIRGAAATLAPVDDFKVDIGTPGQATTLVKPVKGARSYIHQYTADPITGDSSWVSETVTERQHTFNNLPSVTKFWFRVVVVGRNRQTVYSPTVARVIQ